MLVLVVFVILTAGLAGCMFFRSRAPAVSLALLGGLTGGLCGYLVGIADGPRGVPIDVAVWASCGLVAFGAVGLLVLRGSAPVRFLRRSAIVVLAAGPGAAAILALLLLWACPLYVTKHSGVCYHEVDVLGGWISGAVALFGLDVAALVVVLLVAAWQATTPDRVRPGMGGTSAKPAYVVLRQVGKDTWQVVGQANRKPGLTARAARAQAIEDATGGSAKPSEVYRAVLRSEWRIAAE